MLLVAGYLAADSSPIDWQPTADHLNALFWLLPGGEVSLPSAIIAWTEREV